MTEPKKLLPKMTIVGIPSYIEDNEILPTILNKNSNIKTLVNEGMTLNLIFARQNENGQTKTAVVKMSPEIRQAIVEGGNFVYAGLMRCKAYDRFWVTQCHHCQRFGHSSDRCTRKNEAPTCGFCAGNHESKNCSNKQSPKCVNCVNNTSASNSEPPLHFASSHLCPIMISQRNKVIENTNFACSKN